MSEVDVLSVLEYYYLDDIDDNKYAFDIQLVHLHYHQSARNFHLWIWVFSSLHLYMFKIFHSEILRQTLILISHLDGIEVKLYHMGIKDFNVYM